MVNAGFMRYLANRIKKELRNASKRLTGKEDEFGFFLVVFRFRSPGTTNYISSGEREDCIKMLRETADRLEAGQVFGTREDN